MADQMYAGPTALLDVFVFGALGFHWIPLCPVGSHWRAALLENRGKYEWNDENNKNIKKFSFGAIAYV